MPSLRVSSGSAQNGGFPTLIRGLVSGLNSLIMLTEECTGLGRELDSMLDDLLHFAGLSARRLDGGVNTQVV